MDLWDPKPLLEKHAGEALPDSIARGRRFAFIGAKARLGAAVPAHLRQGLALAMLEDVLNAVAGVRNVAGLIVVTADEAAAALAGGYSARIIVEGATTGHAASARSPPHGRQEHRAFLTDSCLVHPARINLPQSLRAVSRHPLASS